MRRRAHALTLLLLALFVAFGSYRFAWRDLPRGDDLASSYLGCRLLAHGLGDHLFSYDEDQFSDTGDDDDVWEHEADSGDYTSYHHPYVQTPLWAWSLRPLCQGQWPLFERVFVVLALLSFAGCAWIAARFWSPSPGFGLLLTAVLLAWLWLSQPFQYAMYLGQTHVLFVLLTLAALVLAQRNYALAAGAALALAAGIKVTPAIFIVYWIANRRWKAAGAAVGFSALLLAGGYLAVGPALMHEYFDTLHRASRTLLLATNNQSLDAWWMARFYPRAEVDRFTILPLPAALRIGSELLLLGLAVFGGYVDRVRQAAPAGAMLTLVAATVLAPIAWTHYSIVLYAPLFVLVTQARALRWPLALAAALVAGALNVPPFAPDLVNTWWPVLAPLRAEFFACALTLVALAVTGCTLRRRTVVTQGT